MPESIIGATIAAAALLIVAMLGACVKLAINGRRTGNPNGRSSCPAQGPVAAVKQSMDTFHPQLAHALERLADAETKQATQLTEIATLLDSRLPRGGGS